MTPDSHVSWLITVLFTQLGLDGLLVSINRSRGTECVSAQVARARSETSENSISEASDKARVEGGMLSNATFLCGFKDYASAYQHQCATRPRLGSKFSRSSIAVVRARIDAPSVGNGAYDWNKEPS